MRQRKAFTLIELLVVVSIIALLVAILMPALGRAKEQARITVCLANQKNLVMAWSMYNDDSEGRLVPNGVYQNTMIGAGSGAWVEPPQLPDGPGPDFSLTPAQRYRGQQGHLVALANPDQARRNGLRAGLMWKYLKSEDVYHCPGDKRHIRGSKSGNTADHHIFRTYSLPRGCGPTPINNYRIVTRITDIKRPGDKYIFVEESYDVGFLNNSLNYSDWWVIDYNRTDPSQYEFWNTLSIFHNKSSSFSFADGHVELQRWVEPETIEHFNDREIQRLAVPNNRDCAWLIRHHPATRF